MVSHGKAKHRHENCHDNLKTNRIVPSTCCCPAFSLPPKWGNIWKDPSNEEKQCTNQEWENHTTLHNYIHSYTCFIVNHHFSAGFQHLKICQFLCGFFHPSIIDLKAGRTVLQMPGDFRRGVGQQDAGCVYPRKLRFEWENHRTKNRKMEVYPLVN